MFTSQWVGGHYTTIQNRHWLQVFAICIISNSAWSATKSPASLVQLFYFSFIAVVQSTLRSAGQEAKWKKKCGKGSLHRKCSGQLSVGEMSWKEMSGREANYSVVEMFRTVQVEVMSGENCPWVKYGCPDRMQEYTFLYVPVMICGSLVNTQTQTHTDSFWLAILLAQPADLKQEIHKNVRVSAMFSVLAQHSV